MSKSGFQPLREEPKGATLHEALSALAAGGERPGGWTEEEKGEVAALSRRAVALFAEWKGEWCGRDEVRGFGALRRPCRSPVSYVSMFFNLPSPLRLV